MANDLNEHLPRNLRVPVEEPKRPVPKVKRPRPPSAPSWLPSDARGVWREVIGLMLAAGTWRPQYAPTLATFAVLQAEFRAAPTKFSAARLSQLRLFACELGLTPSAAAKGARA